MHRPYCRTDGFTLIEILMVVSILGILATIVIIRTEGYGDTARRQQTWATIHSVKTAIGSFEMTLGRYPNDMEELIIEGDKDWPGPFLDVEETPKDGWGNELKFEIRGKRLRVTAPGKDGQFGTDDDQWK